MGGNTAGRLPASTVYIVINNRLKPEFGLVPRSVLGVLGGTMSAAIKAQTRGAIAMTRAYAARTGLDLRVAEIDDRFDKVSPGLFDHGYMKALFEHGESLGRAGTAFAGEHLVAPKGKIETGDGNASAQPANGLARR